MKARGCAGFTLLELLVALAVFAVLSVMAYSGLRSVLDAKQTTDAHAARLTELQSALMMIGRDVSQAVPREIRDEYGDTQPALVGASTGESVLELTRAGWDNPAGEPRSTLQRVAYGVEDDALMRASWRVLDRAPDSEPYRFALLQDVASVTVRFMDKDRQWQEQWPPDTRGETQPAAPLPLAVEVEIELNDWGVIRRLYRMPAVVGRPLKTGDDDGKT